MYSETKKALDGGSDRGNKDDLSILMELVEPEDDADSFAALADRLAPVQEPMPTVRESAA